MLRKGQKCIEEAAFREAPGRSSRQKRRVPFRLSHDSLGSLRAGSIALGLPRVV